MKMLTMKLEGVADETSISHVTYPRFSHVHTKVGVRYHFTMKVPDSSKRGA
jgi:hypothetical protein